MVQRNGRSGIVLLTGLLFLMLFSGAIFISLNAMRHDTKLIKAFTAKSRDDLARQSLFHLIHGYLFDLDVADSTQQRSVNYDGKSYTVTFTLADDDHALDKLQQEELAAIGVRDFSGFEKVDATLSVARRFAFGDVDRDTVLEKQNMLFFSIEIMQILVRLSEQAPPDWWPEEPAWGEAPIYLWQIERARP